MITDMRVVAQQLKFKIYINKSEAGLAEVFRPYMVKENGSGYVCFDFLNDNLKCHVLSVC